MNDHQLLCFLTVSRTLNFSSAARELYCTQPALSYQIRSLEKELDVALFHRSTTSVALTEAGRAFLPHAQNVYRDILNARNEIRPYARQKHLILNLPLVLLQRDPIYPVLMERLHTEFPGYELEIRTDPVQGSLHRFLTTEADAAVYLPLSKLQPEIDATPLVKNSCYLVASPQHPLANRRELFPADLSNTLIYCEPIFGVVAEHLRSLPEMPYSAPRWRMVDTYETVYASLLAGKCLLISPMKYPVYPDDWYHPVQMSSPMPDTCLLTLRDDPRPEITHLKQIFQQVYREFFEESF